VVEATQYLKDAAYKVCYHIMPGLPGSDPDRDLEMVKTIFSDPRFMPDCVKVYPTLVVSGTELYEEWLRGLYRSYDEGTWRWLLARIMASIPRWVRVMRFGRDIPLHWVVDGPRIGNLREVVMREMEREGLKCVEIRCREVGHKYVKRGLIPMPRRLRINRIDYEASGGHEVFLEVIDDDDTLYGILRLRIPSDNAHRPEIRLGRSALIRELHVYGPELPVGSRASDPFWWQHRGIGRALMAKAEHIALEEFNAYRMFVISGVGVREYYRRLGYRKYPGSFYMFKDLRRSILNEVDINIDNVQTATADYLVIG
jgi:elongator complex protein 3